MHRLQFVFQSRTHLLAGAYTSLSRALGIVASLAVQAVKRADFTIVGHQVNSKRRAEPAAVDWSENRVVKQYCHHISIPFSIIR